MSALEQGSPHSDRRISPRLRVGGTHPVIIGRGEGVLMDLSDRGARVRHFAATRRGETVRLTFGWEGERFTAQAEVLASRVISLGTGAGTTFESRLRFLCMDGGSPTVLQSALAGIRAREMRRWVSNLRGWDADADVTRPSAFATSTYIRYRLRGAWWERKNTNDASQPEDGFVVPGDVEESEIRSLCHTYQELDSEGRRIIRLMAAEVVAQSRGVASRHAVLHQLS